MPAFKYKEQQKLLKNCPPQRFKNLQREAFRLVRSDPPTANDFLPCAICQPARVFPNSELECSALGLSLFGSASDLEAKFTKLRKNMKNFPRVFGDKIARGLVSYNHGVSDTPNTEGHFTLHEYDNCELHKEFKVIGLFEAQQKAG